MGWLIHCGWIISYAMGGVVIGLVIGVGWVTILNTRICNNINTRICNTTTTTTTDMNSIIKHCITNN